MPDISKCEGKDCPLKYKCYRFTCIGDSYSQSYFMEPPYKDGKCDYFMEIRNPRGTDIMVQPQRLREEEFQSSLQAEGGSPILPE